MPSRGLVVASLLAFLLGTPSAYAGGPLVLFDAATRTPYHYGVGGVSVYTDLGANGMLTNAQSDTLTAHAFAQWTAVPTSYFSGAIAGKIQVGGVPTDITFANVDSVIGHFNGGGIHVIYDTDGSILANYFGAPPGVAGVASPEYAETGSPILIESFALFNGAAIDPSDTSPIPGASFAGVYTHELGHSINLAHTQVNGGAIFFGDEIGASGCSPLAGLPGVEYTETMYPFIDPSPGSTGLYQATVNLPDDITAISDLYPTGGWPGNKGTITGKIFMPDGVSEVRGVNVIARNVANPVGDAVSALSGDYTQGRVGPDGLYTLHGLTPGAQYVVYVDKIVDGGFSTAPTDTAFLEEYWNAGGESGDLNNDPACASVSITAVAGSPATANILLNIDPYVLNLADDDAVQVSLPFPFHFGGTAYTSVWVGSNGFVTFGVGDTNPSADATGLRVGAPRICGMWDDLDPSAGGVISARPVGGNFQIQYQAIPEIFFAGLNTFTITLRPDGTHRVDYGQTNTIWFALAGRSPGAGAPDPGPTDLSVAAQPLGQTEDTVYEEFFLGDDLASLSLEYAPLGQQVAVPEPGLIPPAAALLQSLPNPFRSRTVIGFDLPAAGPVRLRVFDLQGRWIQTLVDQSLPAGRHAIPWRGDDAQGQPAGAGVYFYRLETPSFEATRKTVLLP